MTTTTNIIDRYNNELERLGVIGIYGLRLSSSITDKPKIHCPFCFTYFLVIFMHCMLLHFNRCLRKGRT